MKWFSRKLSKLCHAVELMLKSMTGAQASVDDIKKDLVSADRRQYVHTGVTLARWLPFESAAQVNRFFAKDRGSAERQAALTNMVLELSRGEPRNLVAREVVMLLMKDTFRQVNKKSDN